MYLGCDRDNSGDKISDEENTMASIDFKAEALFLEVDITPNK